MNLRDTIDPDRLRALNELHGMGLLSAEELGDEVARLAAEAATETDGRRRWFLRRLGTA